MFRQTRRLLLGPIFALTATAVALAAYTSPALADSSPTVRVDSGWLNVRGGTSTKSPVVDRLRDGSKISIVCQATGQYIDAGIKPSNKWDRLSGGRYVSHAYIAGGAGIRSCDTIPVRPTARDTPPKPASKLATVQTAGTRLNVRSGPGTSAAIVDTLANGAALTIVCQADGTQISGAVRTSTKWDQLPNGNYVSHAYIKTEAAFPACRTSTPAIPAGSVTNLSNADFIAAAVAPAQRGQREFNVPASVTIAQAILESGWGRSGLTSNDRNYFGIKCFNNYPGPIANGCHDYRTYECLPTCSQTTASFRTYASMTDSFRDHGRFLTVNSRYQPAFNHTNDADQFIYQIWKAGYATDPNYVTSVQSLMRRYNLYQYDRP